jgi:hypothetical protein
MRNAVLLKRDLRDKMETFAVRAMKIAVQIPSPPLMYRLKTRAAKMGKKPAA